MTQQDKNAVIAELKDLMGNCTGIIALTIEDCINVVQEMPETASWISTAERMPDDAEVRRYYRKHKRYPRYLAAVRGAMMATALEYWGDDTWVGEDGLHYDVTDWQPLPAMPGKKAVP